MNIFDRWTIVVKQFKFEIKNLPRVFKGFKILHLTDLHSKWFGSGQEDLMKVIDEFEFHMIAITGDIVNKNKPDIAPGIRLIEELKAKGVPIFFVSGNHEWDSGYEIKSHLETMGVRVLSNENYSFLHEEDFINIIGVDDPHMKMSNLESAMNGVVSGVPNLLLAHAPNILKEAVANKIDLVLVGHTHGGQGKLPFFGPVYAPGQGFFPKHVHGVYKNGSTTMLVNGGIGESRMPLRVLNKPEIAIVELY